MDHNHLEELIKDVTSEYSEILENSEQGIYIYLADDHKACNKKFSDMLGYSSPDAWAKNEDSFTDVFVEDDSAAKLVGSYRDAMEKMVGSEFSVTWKKKDGGKIKTKVILVPIAHNGHTLALHFVTQISES